MKLGAQEFLTVLDLVLREGKVQGPLIWSVTGRDWSEVKSSGKCQGQNLKMAGGAEEEFPQLRHCSHQHHLRKQVIKITTIFTFSEIVFTNPGFKGFNTQNKHVNIMTLRTCRG